VVRKFFLFASSSLTGAIYKHFIFDIELFTHLNIRTSQTFTNGEKITGSTSNAIGFVQSLSSTKDAVVTNISQPSTGTASVVTSNGHYI
jgi:hypothetical protein